MLTECGDLLPTACRQLKSKSKKQKVDRWMFCLFKNLKLRCCATAKWIFDTFNYIHVLLGVRRQLQRNDFVKWLHIYLKCRSSTLRMWYFVRSTTSQSERWDDAAHSDIESIGCRTHFVSRFNWIISHVWPCHVSSPSNTIETAFVANALTCTKWNEYHKISLQFGFTRSVFGALGCCVRLLNHRIKLKAINWKRNDDGMDASRDHCHMHHFTLLLN